MTHRPHSLRFAAGSFSRALSWALVRAFSGARAGGSGGSGARSAALARTAAIALSVAAVGAVVGAVSATPAAARAALSADEAYVERAQAIALDDRCGMFDMGPRLTLEGGALLARNALLRADWPLETIRRLKDYGATREIGRAHV